MKAGFVGLPGSGKSTLFRAVTGSDGTGDPFRTVEVPDQRIDQLAGIYNPKKSTYAKFECHDLAGIGVDDRHEGRLFGAMRQLEALALVVRCFESDAYPYDRPEIDVTKDMEDLVSAFQVADFMMVENRVDKLEKQVLKPTKTQDQDKKELAVLTKLKGVLEGGSSIDDVALNDAEEELIRGFGFLTQKPKLVVLDLPDEGADEAALRALVPDGIDHVLAIRGAIEAEIASLDPADAREFMADYGIERPARDRLVAELYGLLGLHSFLTAGEDECRAWTIPQGASAHDSAGTIHSDIQRGFIRAEVIPFVDLVAAGGFKDAKAAGHMRLEGKEYRVADGEVINFRFSV